MTGSVSPRRFCGALRYGFARSPFGLCLIATLDDALCALFFVKPDQCDDAIRALQQRFPDAAATRDDLQAQELAKQIFVRPGSGQSEPRLAALAGTDFQLRVWNALRRIPSGTTVSYGDIAAAIGQPKAVRAVGTAVGANPLAFVIPCHRVIHKDGSIGGYRWGVDVKRAILEWERFR